MTDVRAVAHCPNPAACGQGCLGECAPYLGLDQSIRAVAPPSDDLLSLLKALEFAEYMAKGAEQLLKAMNDSAEIVLRFAESDDGDPEDLEEVEQAVSEHMRGLASDIYEFRKRVCRARDRYPQGGDTVPGGSVATAIEPGCEATRPKDQSNV
jgi:hypothetical protein